MLDSLRFVKGSVAKKDFVAALTHYCIKDGRIQGYNGALSLSSPIALGLDCNPKAGPFARALDTCKETISLHMTPAGRLSIKSGKFKALVDCIPESFPAIEPEGEAVKLEGIKLLPALKVLKPFIAEDASRPWARGILLRGQSALATNNVVIVEMWVGAAWPVEVNIPQEAVVELLRIGEEPESLQINERSVTFHYEGHRWLKTNLLTTEWPNIAKVLDTPSEQGAVPPGFFEALHDLVPFEGELEKVYLREGHLQTEEDPEQGASCEMEGVVKSAAFNIHQLLKLEGVAKTIDLGAYPKPSLFTGDKLRGAIVGMR